MKVQISSLLIVAQCFIACSFFENNANRDLIKKVDTIVDFNTVDAFPLFPKCKDIPSRKKQQICFQIAMSEHIYGSLKNYQFKAVEMINDTILVKLKVDSNGVTSLLKTVKSVRTGDLVPEFDSLIQASLKELPKLLPAIKRDMPVSTAFTLPVVLKN